MSQALASMHLRSKHLASPYCIPGTILDMVHEAVKKKKKKNSLSLNDGVYQFCAFGCKEQNPNTQSLNQKANFLLTYMTRILVEEEGPGLVHSVDQ